MKNYFSTLNLADDHLLREAISANNYDENVKKSRNNRMSIKRQGRG